MNRFKIISKDLWSKYRHEISSEIHRRPYYEQYAPMRISLISLHTKNYENNYRHLNELCDYLAIPAPEYRNLTYSYNHQDKFRVKWESHREFCTFQFIKNMYLDDTSLFGDSNINLVPNLWINNLDSVINCVNLDVINKRDIKSNNDEFIFSSFNNNYVVGSNLCNKKGSVFSDFKIDTNGYHRILLINGDENGEMTGHQLGRSIQRVLDIESYRSMSMISFIKSKNINLQLDEINSKLMKVNEIEDSNKKFIKLKDISDEINFINIKNKFRFQASKGYYPIVDERLNELNFSKIEGMQPYDVYLNSRINPTKRATLTTENRLNETLELVSKNILLIKTQIELDIKKNSIDLLDNMSKKKDIQIKLQKTVEGLSTIILTYYSVNLFSYLLKGFNVLNIYSIDNDLISSLIIMPIGYYFYKKNSKL